MQMPYNKTGLTIFSIGFMASLFSPTASAAKDSGLALDITGTSLIELMNLKITSLSKRQEPLIDAAASVFIITRKDILRAGITSIPEALRLAPGVEVARGGANSWTISIRGFNNDLSNKLLVLIDGRSVYSPLFAGVFWDVQDTLMEDIDRIEVISGPGGTLWGSNAVNGVINIITRSSKETTGGFAELGTGNEERILGGVRYGSKLNEHTYARAYAKHRKQDDAVNESGDDTRDDWRMSQSGFRMDWHKGADTLTVQGDYYTGENDGLFRGDFTLGTLPGTPQPGKLEVSGGNILTQWEHEHSSKSIFSTQLYYDHTNRKIPGTYDERRDTIDLEFQHHWILMNRHEIVWGTGFRITEDDINNTLFATFDPDQRRDETYHLFIQDEIDLWQEELFLTLGTKYEHNSYTGDESQPNIRLSWVPDSRQTYWVAASKAVRIPSRLDADLELTAPIDIDTIPFPVYANVQGNHEFKPEELKAYEAGSRLQVKDNLSIDIALFYNEYDHLQTTEPQTPVIETDPPGPYILLPGLLANGMEAHSSGGTLVVRWQPTESWRLRFQYAYLDLDLDSKADSQDVDSLNIEDESPKNQAAIYSYFDITSEFSFYTGTRYVEELPTQNVDDYIAVDVSLNWHPASEWEASLTINNLNDGEHLEVREGGGNEIERSAIARVAYRFE